MMGAEMMQSHGGLMGSVKTDNARRAGAHTENVAIVRLAPSGWQILDAGQAATPIQDLKAAPLQGRIFAVPCDQLRLITVELDAAERKHIRKVLPFRIEEDFVDEIDSLHVAVLSLHPRALPVAVVARDLLADWQAQLGESFEGPWVPEVLLLPWRAGEVCILLESDSALVRFGEWAGARVELELLNVLLLAQAEPVQKLVIYTLEAHPVLSWLPEAMGDRVEIRKGDFSDALRLSDTAKLTADIRQGEFAPQLPLARWWNQWRQVAIAAGLAIGLQVVTDVMAYQRLKAENLQLRAAIQASYRQANPRGAIVDVEKQLDRQLAEYAPAGQAKPFTPALAGITSTMAAAADVSIASLVFNAANDEVRVDIGAEDYAAVERVRAALESKGYRATLETSSSRNDRISARLRIALS